MNLVLGCMRLSTEPDRSEERAREVIEAALAAGFTSFDTAHAYGLGQDDLGHNERLLGRLLASRSADAPAVRVITKCGMRREGGAWIPDGRARTIAEDVEASLAALGGVPIDLLLLHAPDPKVDLATTARALARLRAQGLVRAIGASNVTRRELDVLTAHAPISAISVALGAYDDLALRAGVVSYARARGMEIFAHAPFGGVKRAPKVARDPVLRRFVPAGSDTTGADVLLAYLRAAAPDVMPIVGARTPETVRRLASGASLALGPNALTAIDARFPVWGALRTADTTATVPARDVEVVLLMGIQGAGKSRAAEDYVARGYERLNRDVLGGTLRGIARRLEDRLAEGATRIVLDNTYVSRASRNDVVRIARGHGARVRCVYFDTPIHEAHLNVLARMLERFGRVLSPEELRAHGKLDPVALAPHAVMRLTKQLEPPEDDEGFDAIEIVRFERDAVQAPRGASFVALDVARGPEFMRSAIDALAPELPVLFYGWAPRSPAPHIVALEERACALAETCGRMIEVHVCVHPGGPPVCWCRPPMPGAMVAFAHRHGLALRASTVYGEGATDRAIARALGATFRARAG